MKKFVVAAALALMFVWTPQAQGQDMTVASYAGSWTTIGQLPSGVRHVTKDAQEVNVVLQIQTKKPQGQLVMGSQQIQWKNIVTAGEPPVDNFSFGMELRPDYWVSCRLAGVASPRRRDRRAWGTDQRTTGRRLILLERSSANSNQEGRQADGGCRPFLPFVDSLVPAALGARPHDPVATREGDLQLVFPYSVQSGLRYHPKCEPIGCRDSPQVRPVTFEDVPSVHPTAE
jgi:hypothetical protein